MFVPSWSTIKYLFPHSLTSFNHVLNILMLLPVVAPVRIAMWRLRLVTMVLWCRLVLAIVPAAAAAIGTHLLLLLVLVLHQLTSVSAVETAAAAAVRGCRAARSRSH